MNVASLRAKRVCVVDDDDSVRDSLKFLLETYGLTVDTYRSGIEFFADRARSRANCVIVDQHLPILNGLDIVERLHAEGSTIPAILITGRPDPTIHRRARDIGLPVLEKPFGCTLLIKHVENALDAAAHPHPRAVNRSHGPAQDGR